MPLDSSTDSDRSEKLQKVLADRGYGSRREMERWIDSGRVVVDGKLAHPGQRVLEGARIEVDGKRVRDVAPLRLPRVLVMNKKTGEIVSRSKHQDCPTVFERLPSIGSGRWIVVGRLDINTSGLLLFTNHGLLAHRLMHPSTEIDREYAVRVIGELSNERMQSLREGIRVDGSLLQFSDIQYYGGTGLNHWYHVVLMDGKNRAVRKLFEGVGSKVSRLKRVRFGPVILPKGMKTGKVHEMGPSDVTSICDWLSIPNAQQQTLTLKQRTEQSLLIPFPGVKLPASV